MKRMSQEQIQYNAKKHFNTFVAAYGLRDSLKVVLSLRRLLLEEERRRKLLKSSG